MSSTSMPSPRRGFAPGFANLVAALSAGLKRGLYRMAEALVSQGGHGDPERDAVLIRFPF